VVGTVSVCTSVLVLVPIVISLGMVVVCRFSGSFIESGEVARSSSVAGGFSTLCLASSCVISFSISVRLAPM
jgi:hypothetical protein